jgi:hypothetical protein
MLNGERSTATKQDGEACSRCGEHWDRQRSGNTKAHLRGKGLTPIFHGGQSKGDRAMINVYNRGQSWDDMEAQEYPGEPSGRPVRREE